MSRQSRTPQRWADRQPRILSAYPAACRVTTAPDTNDQIMVAVDDWDDGAHDWGPVPYLHTDGPAQAGDTGWLHIDQRGRAAYAVLWPQS